MIINLLKKLSMLLAIMFLGLGSFSVEAKNVESNNTKPKVLIIYFSHTGNTKLMAEKTQEELSNSGCKVDLQRIEPTKKYPEYGEKLRNLALKEADDDNCRPKFKKIKIDVQKYDLILVGTPVWWHKAPKIMLSFLETQNFSGKKVRFFITHGGDPGTCISDMETVCNGANFGENVDTSCNYPGNGEVDYTNTISWIQKIKKEKKITHSFYFFR